MNKDSKLGVLRSIGKNGENEISLIFSVLFTRHNDDFIF